MPVVNEISKYKVKQGLSIWLKKTNIYRYFRDVFLFYLENVCSVYSLE